MPCYHCSIKAPLTKAKGKSLIAKAAYNARTQYRDERDGKLTRNYESHGDVLASYVQHDDRIKPPGWVKDDPQKMLNEAVRGLRSNARQGQEIIFGLIDEFDLERNRWLLNDFLREQVCRKTGHVVFVNIHPPGKGDERNSHAHVLLMPRGLTNDGFTKEVMPSLTPQDYDRIRDKWAEYGARELRKLPGMDLEADRYRWGHLKLRMDPDDKRTMNGNNQLDKAKERGDEPWAVHCDREAKQHLGPDGVAMDRHRGTRKAEINRGIDDQLRERQEVYNAEKMLASLPAGITIPLGLERRNAPVWLALERSKTATEFRANLKTEGWQLARVTAEDVEISKSRQWLADQFDAGHRPILREGDYLVVNKRGMAFFLNEKSTGKSFREMKAFMATLDKEHVNSLRVEENFALHKMGTLANARTGRKSGLGKDIGIGALRKASRVAGTSLGLVGAGVSLLASVSRTLTPEQKVGRNLDDMKKKLAAQKTEQAKNIQPVKDFERERD